MHLPELLFDEVFPTNICGVRDSLPFHVFTAAENSMGTVSCNVAAKLVFLNLIGAGAAKDGLELATVALAEMSALGTSTLVYDLRYCPGFEGSGHDVAIRAFLLESGTLTELAMLTRTRAEPEGHGVRLCSFSLAKVEVSRACTVRELVHHLKASRPVLALEYADSTAIRDFSANYGGSVFAVPELRATVVRMSGNGVQPSGVQELFRAAVALHLERHASTLILDTSDSPTLTKLEESKLFNDAVIAPLSVLGLAAVLVHVRGDEIGTGCERAPLAKLEVARYVFECEAATVPGALALIRTLNGGFIKPPSLPLQRTPLTRLERPQAFGARGSRNPASSWMYSTHGSSRPL